MHQLGQASVKSIGSIFAPGMLGVLVASLALTLVALIVFIISSTWLGAYFSSSVTDPRLADWLPWITGTGASIFAYFLFPGVMPLFVNFFDSKIATLIERQDYPGARPINPPLLPELLHDIRFSIVAIALNILVLPLYLTGIGFIVFFLLNGHLLGKEFFIMVARRYVSLEKAKELRRRNSRTIFVGGILLTVLATIPLLNLLAPFWGIAVMTHLYHAIGGIPKINALLTDY